MLKKTLTAAITAAVLLSAGALRWQKLRRGRLGVLQKCDQVFKTKAGFVTLKKIELENPQAGIWKAEGLKEIDGVEVEYETTIDHTGKVISEKKD